MNIALDISGTKISAAGTTVYTLQLLRAMRQAAPDNEYTELCYEPIFSRKRRLLRIVDTLVRDMMWTHRSLQLLVEKVSPDILHVPGPVAPSRTSCPIVVTVFDLHTYQHPADYKVWQRLSVNHALPKITRHADAILTISDYVRDALLSEFPWLSPDKVVTTHLGVSEQFVPIDRTILDPFSTKYTLQRPFVLAVSTMSPNKNVPRLIRAFKAIHDRIDHDLVLIGSEGWKQQSVLKIAASEGIIDRVHYLGYIPDADLPALYNLADLFVFPSLYEGFGLPLLEAMACGTPVLTSNVTSMPEVAGDAAILVDPTSVEEIADRMLHVLSSESTQSQMKESGLKRKDSFSWQRCAEKTLETYQMALNA